MNSTIDDDPEARVLAELLSRTALGDRAAFKRLYDRVRAHLFGVILRINNDRAQAEELLQDVFVNIWRHAHTYDLRRSQPMAWLSSVARYRAIDSIRQRRSAPVTVSGDRTEDDDGDGLIERVADEHAGPEEQLALSQETTQLQRCMGELSSQQRQCVTLAYVHGFSHLEVADHLRQPLGSVKSWVRRGMLALQRCMTSARVNVSGR